MPSVLSVNVGLPRPVEWNGETVLTGIRKEAVEGRLAVRGVNIEGDDQADRTVHGGVDKAVYAYAMEDYEWWESELKRPLPPAVFGENLTVSGLDLGEVVVGERWQVGSTLLEVSEPRFPCFKLGIAMGDPRFLKKFAQARRTGTYLRIVGEGDIGAGDLIDVVHRPAHEVTIRKFADAFLEDREALPELLAAEELSESWREWISDSEL